MKEELFGKILQKIKSYDKTQESLTVIIQVNSHEEVKNLVTVEPDFTIQYRDMQLIHNTNLRLKVRIVSMRSAEDWDKVMGNHFGIAFISSQAETLLKTRILSRVRQEPFKSFIYGSDDFWELTNEDLDELVEEVNKIGA